MKRLALQAMLGAAVSWTVLCGVSFAQEQPAAGSPPPGATSQAPAAPAPAQNMQPSHAPDPMRQTKMMAKRLGLTPDQQARIEPIIAGRMQQVQGVRADTTLAPGDRRARVQGIMQDSDSRIEAVLSDSQKQQYEQMKQAQKDRRQQRGPQQTGAPSPANQ
jgi:periplasmic protein CpxP/Spy